MSRCPLHPISRRAALLWGRSPRHCSTVTGALPSGPCSSNQPPTSPVTCPSSLSAGAPASAAQGTDCSLAGWCLPPLLALPEALFPGSHGDPSGPGQLHPPAAGQVQLSTCPLSPPPVLESPGLVQGLWPENSSQLLYHPPSRPTPRLPRAILPLTFLGQSTGAKGK